MSKFLPSSVTRPAFGFALLLTLCAGSTAYSKILNDSILLHQLIHDIRNPQADLKEFRQSLERIGEVLGAEVLQSLKQKEVQIGTLTGATANHLLVDEKPVLLTILRAGLPLLLGVQKIFPNSEVGFLAMSRDEETLEAKTDYIAIPEIKGKTVILTDTMLATGGSMIDAIKIVQKHQPKEIILISVIASEAGIERVSKHDSKIRVYSAAIDPILNNKGYIVPGLGDAGDRSYGLKVIR